MFQMTSYSNNFMHYPRLTVKMNVYADEWHPLMWSGKSVSACSSGSRIWSGGQIFSRDLANIVKWSQVSEVSQYWPESRAHLRALGALAFLTLKYAFSHFSWYFFFKILMYISVGTLTNIYFNVKDSDHLGKCNFAFLHMKKSRVFISLFGLVCRYITL